MLDVNPFSPDDEILQGKFKEHLENDDLMVRVVEHFRTVYWGIDEGLGW